MLLKGLKFIVIITIKKGAFLIACHIGGNGVNS